MKPIFEIKRASDGKYAFNLKSANNHVILTSQTYDSKEGVEGGIASVRQNAALDERYEEKTSERDYLYFLLIAGNEQVIGRSQMYATRGALRKGIASVKRNAQIAEAVDFSAYVQSVAGEGSRGSS
jgi:uncharacterized protein YegP (UPF0339 family)